ncbi:MAG TPA: histidine kinase dimerization/phospho-acceptor domain-containing protein, partial [Burkholderiaceae bacterium]|nr:histidine kinase dimerization/phospho-acceptor domain-containing protein [Burkholderiaceae bacterium]
MTTSALPATDRTTGETVPATPPARAPAPPLSRYLVALVAVAVLPLLIVASVLIWREGVDERKATEAALQSTAQALSVAVDRQLTSYRRVLEALAASDMIDRRDFVSLHAYAKRVADLKGAIFISLFEPSGRQVFNTARVFGEALPDPFREAQPVPPDAPPRGDASSLRRVFTTGHASNSDLFYGLATGQLMFTVDVPVVRDGKVVYVMNAAFPPKLVTDLLTTDEDLKQVHTVVVDGRGFVVARWRDAERFAGVRVESDSLSLIAHGDLGSAFTRTLDGDLVFRSFARSPQSGWSTLVSIDAAYLQRQESRTWLIWGSGAVVALLLSLGLATWLARGLDGSIVRLAKAAGEDDAPSDYGLRSRELDRLRDALAAARHSRRAALQLRESALREEGRRVEAEAANREKDRFMAAVVHELRTPLSALANVGALLRAGVADSRVTDIVQRQVAQLARLVDDLMETSRINFGKF